MALAENVRGVLNYGLHKKELRIARMERIFLMEFCGQAANVYEFLNGKIRIHRMLASKIISNSIRKIREIRS